LPFSMLQLKRPYFASLFRETSGKLCPAFQKSRPQGLATLSTVSAPFNLGSIFQPPTLLGLPFRALLLRYDRCSLSKTSLRSGALLQNLSASHRRFSGLFPQRKPCLCLLPGGLDRDETSCSPGLSGLSGSLFSEPAEKASLFLNALPVL
jgi:hypothetical protein